MKKLSIATALLLFLFSCQKEQNLKNETSEKAIANSASAQSEKFNTFNGDEIAIGNGYAHTFITQSHTGVPQELGIVFTDEALSGLPTVNTPYVLDFHPKALESTLFKHLSMGWNYTGHPLPGGAFIPSHFDIRFFMMSNEDRLAIPNPAPLGFTNPPTGYMPADYVADAVVPQIGRHWAPNNFTSGQTVDHTMILGTYNGSFTFVSPIVRRTVLESGTGISLPYPQPQYFAVHGYYPTKYNIYEDNKNRHYVSLSDFVWR
ncbi:MAG: DUF5602 domain-containing protein [Sphingobacteriales bacterium]|nr:DUF5602 domain-containing protein [Sphingobacteriales bacterium]